MVYTSVWLWPVPDFGNCSAHNFIAFVTYWGCLLGCLSKRACCLQSGVYSAVQSAGKSLQKCLLHAMLPWRWSGSPKYVVPEWLIPVHCQIFWFDPAKLLRSWSALRMWVVPLKWSGLRPCWCGDSTRSLAGSSPWIERPCAGGRERGDCWHSCHRVAPWNLGQKHIGLFCLMPICLKSSNCASQDQQRRLKPLTPVSLICWQQCQAQNPILSGCQVSQRLQSAPEGDSWGFMFHQQDEW